MFARLRMVNAYGEAGSGKLGSDPADDCRVSVTLTDVRDALRVMTVWPQAMSHFRFARLRGVNAYDMVHANAAYARYSGFRICAA